MTTSYSTLKMAALGEESLLECLDKVQKPISQTGQEHIKKEVKLLKLNSGISFTRLCIHMHWKGIPNTK